MQTDDTFVIATKGVYAPMHINDIIDSAEIENHPLIQAIQQEAKVAKQNKKVERAHGLPTFTLGYSNISLIGTHSKNGIESYYGRDQRFSYIDIGISIPLTYGATRAKIQSLDYTQKSV